MARVSNEEDGASITAADDRANALRKKTASTLGLMLGRRGRVYNLNIMIFDVGAGFGL